MESFKIYSIQSFNGDGYVGCGFPFYALNDNQAIDIVKSACKGINPENADGCYLVQIGEFYPFGEQVISGCSIRHVFSCVDLCDPGEEVSDEGSEV